MKYSRRCFLKGVMMSMLAFFVGSLDHITSYARGTISWSNWTYEGEYPVVITTQIVTAVAALIAVAIGSPITAGIIEVAGAIVGNHCESITIESYHRYGNDNTYQYFQRQITVYYNGSYLYGPVLIQNQKASLTGGPKNVEIGE